MVAKQSPMNINHIGIKKLNAPAAIITGDPTRVPIIAKFLSPSHNNKVRSSRGFLSYQCHFDDKEVLVISTGIGAPSTAIVVEELVELGVGLIIRLGTCGAIQKHIHVGDLIIPTGSVRDEGTSMQYVDMSYPAVPDFHTLYLLVSYAKQQDNPFHVGIVHSKDAYYSEKIGGQLDQHKARQRWEDLTKFGILSTEMESSALFILGSLRKIQTASILINVGKVTDPDVFSQSLRNATIIIREAISSLYSQIRVPSSQEGNSLSTNHLHSYLNRNT
jgi:uridine phosphorylase